MIEHNFAPRECLFLGSREVREFRGQPRAEMVEALVGGDRDTICIVHGHGAYYGIHEHFPGREPRYVVFLRDPVKRVFSNYRYRQWQLQSRREMVSSGTWSQAEFDVWLETKRDFWHIEEFERWFESNDQARNYMSRAVLNRDVRAMPFVRSDRDSPELASDEDAPRVKKLLEESYFVGCVENRSDFLFLYGQLGIHWFTPRQKVLGTPRESSVLTRSQPLVESANRVDRAVYQHAQALGRRFAREHPEYDRLVAKVARRKRIIEPIYSATYPVVGPLREKLKGRFKRFS